MKKTLEINGKAVEFNGEKNLLEVIRKENIDLPTFCYHSELSIYGACRLCVVEVEGRGVQASCSLAPEPGMKVRTNTEQLRKLRKIYIELLLASYNHDCPTCAKNNNCKLQELAYKLGVREIRFKRNQEHLPVDNSSYALLRDPNKCILCGDCVRACEEIQGIGAIDFAFRGAKSVVSPAFGKGLSHIDCVDCGQCSRVCPTGAIVPKSEVAEVWKAIEDKSKVVVAQIAPAVRVAIGEEFGYKSGTIVTGQLIAALKMLGFDKVFDSSFTADLTVIEEANEFIERKTNNENLPLFTSCCPAWVKYVEQYFPEYLHNLSTCRSPQQMFGSIAKSILPDLLGKKREDIVVVSIMPCTAKKVEARRPEFTTDGVQDVDYVLTTQELANMIKQVGIKFENLSPEAFDLPLGFKTGAGVLFGNSGGVSEAVLRYAYEKISGQILDNVDFKEVRGNDAVRETSIQINGQTINLCIIYGLKNAKNVVKQIQNGEKHYDLIEVMACPGGCIGGAGQPVYYDEETRTNRTKGIYDCDKMLQLHKSQENPYVADLYKNILKEPNSEVAHNLLHTHYKSRKRIKEGAMELISNDNSKLQVSVCVGTNCFIKGSQEILKKLINYVEENNLTDTVDIKANFCMENCDEGPSVTIGDKLLKKCSAQSAIKTLETLVSQIA
ncbi:MAG TPA: NADH-dependent [FeFe] hydrogenase, group A6 [Candidatus Kapabacteria bacterium]|jgi:NADH-quinone oxidoreductase subunit G|nr:NADH-dependent [FeFe] hydrogenase, group A6 [Candidatus Kapabacteria bacterium]